VPSVSDEISAMKPPPPDGPDVSTASLASRTPLPLLSSNSDTVVPLSAWPVIVKYDVNFVTPSYGNNPVSSPAESCSPYGLNGACVSSMKGEPKMGPAWLPAASVVLSIELIAPSNRPDRSAVPMPFAVTGTSIEGPPPLLLKVMVAVESSSRPDTSKLTAVFWALLIEVSGIVSARSPKASAVVSMVSPVNVNGKPAALGGSPPGFDTTVPFSAVTASSAISCPESRSPTV
jgi:hypothetical protein